MSSPILSLPFLSFPLFPAPRSGPSNPAKECGGAANEGVEQICSQPTRLEGSKYTNNAFAADPRNVTVKANAAITEFTVRYLAVTY